MISLSALKPDQAAQYFKKDNYYSKDAQKENSRWSGKAAARLGLSGPVEAAAFHHLCHGKTPDGSSTVIYGKKGETIKRAGTDVCFSAPKSVSLLALVAGDERLLDAHREAVSLALSILEERYASTRVGGSQTRTIDHTGNLLMAQFDHDSSREKDPQLHTHCVVLNRTKRRDGAWRSVFHDAFWRHGKLLGTVYQNELARRVQELGYGISTKANGTFEIKGYSQAALSEFSKRSEKIKALACSSKEEERIEKMKIRPPKGKEIPVEEMKAYWKARAEAMALEHPKPQAPGPTSARESNKWVADSFAFAVKSLSERNVGFDRDSLETAMMARSLGQVAWKDVQRCIAEGLSQKKILEARPNGKGQRFTSEAALMQERLCTSLVQESKVRFQNHLTREDINARLDKLQNLTLEEKKWALEQIQMVCCKFQLGDHLKKQTEEKLADGKRLSLSETRAMRGECLSASKLSRQDRVKAARELAKCFEAVEGLSKGQRNAILETSITNNAFIAWQGVAGAGKSFAINEVRKIAQEQGWEVQGFAPSAEAAKTLAAEGKCQANTVASLLHSNSHTQTNSQNENRGSYPGRLWIVDEAGLLGQKDCLELMKKAVECHAKVVFVGDTRQLASVGAGAAFKHLQATGLKTIYLDESRRQKDENLNLAVSLLAHGKVTEAITAIEDKIMERQKELARDRLCAQHYLALSPQEQGRTLILATTHRERESITHCIRSAFLESGRLSKETTISVLKTKDMTEAQKQNAFSFERGDILIQRHRGKETRGVVLESDAITNTLWVQEEKGPIRLIEVGKMRYAGVFKEHSLSIAEGDKMKWTKNDKENHRMNGQEFEIKKIRDDGLEIQYQGGKKEFVSAQQFRHVDYAWTQTKFAAQGKTADRVLVAVDENINKNSLYVAITRAKYDIKIFVDDKEKFLGRAIRSGDKETAHEIVIHTNDSKEKRGSALPKKEFPLPEILI